MKTIELPLGERLSSNDLELEELLQNLLDEVKRGCPIHQAKWGRVERRLIERIEAEEIFLLPTFGCTHPAAAAAIREEHAKLRYLLADMSMWFGTPALTEQNVTRLLEAVRRLASREGVVLYPWAHQLDEGLTSSLLRRLS